MNQFRIIKPTPIEHEAPFHLHANASRNFLKIALGFFPFYSNLQKRLNSEGVSEVEAEVEADADADATISQETAKKGFVVECNDNKDVVPDMEELSMGSGWSTESEGSIIRSTAIPQVAPSDSWGPSYPTDEDKSICAKSSTSTSYSNSFFNFARTPSVNESKRRRRNV